MRGLVSVSVSKKEEEVCDTNNYVVFTDVAKYLDWIQNVIQDRLGNENRQFVNKDQTTTAQYNNNDYTRTSKRTTHRPTTTTRSTPKNQQNNQNNNYNRATNSEVNRNSDSFVPSSNLDVRRNSNSNTNQNSHRRSS